MNKEQEDALLDDPKPAQGYAKLTIRDCIMRRFAKVATPTWEALCQLEAGEISKGKALQIIREEAERMERENFPEMETELQQLRLAADGMAKAWDEAQCAHCDGSGITDVDGEPLACDPCFNRNNLIARYRALAGEGKAPNCSSQHGESTT